MKDADKVAARGQRAVELLADPLVVDAKAHIEAELWRQFQSTLPSDMEALAFIKGMQYLHVKYFAYFSAAVSNGKLAQLEIDRKKKTIRERIGL